MITIYHLDPDTDFRGGARHGAKIVIALRDLAIAHEVKYVDRIRDMRNPRSSFRTQINPWGTVPVIEHDGFTLRESAAILRYLTELAPGSELVPATLQDRALVDQWLAWECSMLTPSLLSIARLVRMGGIDGEAEIMRVGLTSSEEALKIPGMKQAYDRWYQNLSLLDAQLAHGEYVAGRYSIADIALGCAVPIGTNFGATLAPYTNINRWLRLLAQKPNWQRERTFVLDIQEGMRVGLIPCSEEEKARIPERRWAAPPSVG